MAYILPQNFPHTNPVHYRGRCHTVSNSTPESLSVYQEEEKDDNDMRVPSHSTNRGVQHSPSLGGVSLRLSFPPSSPGPSSFFLTLPSPFLFLFLPPYPFLLPLTPSISFLPLPLSTYIFLLPPTPSSSSNLPLPPSPYLFLLPPTSSSSPPYLLSLLLTLTITLSPRSIVC